MSISGEVNGAIRERFDGFRRVGYPGQYVNLPHGFKAEVAPNGDINLFHGHCPGYPVSIGHTEVSPYRWELDWGWEKAIGILVTMLEAEVPMMAEEDVPF